MAAHSYWRLNMSGAQNFPGMSEIVLATTIGGAQTATGGTPIESSNFSTFPASNAFDGNTSTHWISNSTPNAWIGYQFASPVDVAEARATYTYDAGSYAPGSVSLDYSDNGSTWTTVGTVANMEPWSGTRAFRNGTRFTGPGHGWWRAYWINNQGSASFCTAAEVAFALSSGGAQQASNGVACGSSNGGTSYIYSNAFDGSTSTDWVSANGTPSNSWVGYAFSGNTDVREMRITNSASSTAYAPKDLRVDYSDDGVAWTAAATFTGLAAWSASETRAFAVAATAAPAVQASVMVMA